MTEYFKNFWFSETHGKHLHKTEEFLIREAREQLLHLDGGESLIDFGCGAAEALVYYAKAYKTVIGIDFSSSMLTEAKKRLDEKNISNVELLLADNKTAWNMLHVSYDRIMTYGVVQYFSYDELEHFINEASRKINKNGKIVLFLVLHPTRWHLRRMGLLSSDPKLSFVDIFRELVAVLFKRFVAVVQNVPPDELGYAYYPSAIAEIAAKYELQMECVWSIYYADRYNAILTPKQANV